VDPFSDRRRTVDLYFGVCVVLIDEERSQHCGETINMISMHVGDENLFDA